ncbi:MAG: hypothetical protein MOB07_12745 [Acidobacteria bacterium]|nr:hypothetical protein [Acidobacteriota bacterium]
MSTAKELFDTGKLTAAIEELTREVKSNPTDMARRTFLFELLCFAGEWDRAEKQLEVIGSQDVKTEAGVQVYQDNIEAERARRKFFNDGLQPNFLAKPPDYVLLHLSAVSQIREGNYPGARDLLDQAEEQRPAMQGKLNDQPFQDFRDADDLVGPVLELIVQGKYTWFPFEHIQRLEVKPPARLRDLMWTSAQIETTDAIGGFAGEVFIPALYAGSFEHADDLVRLGRMTDWRKISDELATGAGLRLFQVDHEDLALFDAQTIEFNHDAAAT